MKAIMPTRPFLEDCLRQEVKARKAKAVLKRFKTLNFYEGSNTCAASGYRKASSIHKKQTRPKTKVNVWVSGKANIQVCNFTN